MKRLMMSGVEMLREIMLLILDGSASLHFV